VLNVANRAVMGVMGWSHAAMVTRYQHIPDELRSAIAQQFGGLLWEGPDDGEAGGAAPRLVPA
jgi:hypothetical protein